MSDPPITVNALRLTLIALLVVSTALFAAGAIAERSSRADEHAEPAVHESGESPAEAESAGERLLGIDTESTPLLVLAVIGGLALAALAATRRGRLASVLLAIAVIAVIWAALDAREAVHQLDEARTGIAAIAIVVAAGHLSAAAIAARLASRARRAGPETTARAGTMHA
jgi:hypothetical protein